MAARGSYAKGVAKRDEVLRAALAVFAEKGYLKTSIRELAEAANLSQAGLLHYFGSKDELLVEILRRREEENRTTPDGELLEHFMDVMRLNVAVPGLAQLFATMSAAASDDSHPAHELFFGRYQELRERFTKSLRSRQANGELHPDLDPAALATLLIAAADGLQIQWLIDDSVDMPGSLAYLWDVYRWAHRAQL